MFDRQHGKLILVCDTCGDEFEAPADVDACPAFFDAFWEAAKSENWKAKKFGKDWVHACPDCKIDT